MLKKRLAWEEQKCRGMRQIESSTYRQKISE